MHLIGGPTRARSQLLIMALGALLLLAGCGTSGGEAADAPTTLPEISATTAAPSDGAPDEVFEPVDEVPVGGEVTLTSAEVRGSVEAGFASSEMDITDEQLDCYTESLIGEVGLDRLAALGLPKADPLSGSVLSRMTGNIDDAAAYFTPFFDCLESDGFVRESVGDLPPAVQDCVVDAVVADREVRVIYLLGTPEGSEPSASFRRMTDPLVERSQEIEADCLAAS